MSVKYYLDIVSALVAAVARLTGVSLLTVALAAGTYSAHAEEWPQTRLTISSDKDLTALGLVKSKPVTALQLASINDAGNPALSPDGKFVAYSVTSPRFETNDYKVVWRVTSTMNGDSREIDVTGTVMSENEAANAYLPTWSSDSQAVYLIVPDGKSYSVYRYSLADNTTRKVSESYPRIDAMAVTRDAKRLVMKIGDRIASTQLEEPGEFTGRGGLLITPQVQPNYGMGGFRPRKERKTKFVSLSLTDGSSRVASDEEVTSFFDSPELGVTGIDVLANYREYSGNALADDIKENWGEAFQDILSAASSPDGRRLAVSGKFGIRIIDKSTRRVERALVGNYITSRVWYVGENELLFVGGSRSDIADWGALKKAGLYQLGLGAKSAPKLIAQLRGKPSEQFYGFSDRIAGNEIAAVRAPASRPPEVGLLNIRNGRWRQLTNLNPDYPAANMPTLRIDVEDGPGKGSFARILLPTDYVAGKRYPAVVTTYTSTGFMRGGVGDEFPIPVFASNGFVVIDLQRNEVDGGSESNVSVEYYERTSRDPITGLIAIIDQLDKIGVVAPDRIGISGLSNGATLSEWALSRTDRFAAGAVSQFGHFTPVWHSLTSGEGLGEQMGFAAGGPNGPNAANWARVSSLSFIDKFTAPILVNAPETEWLFMLDAYQALKGAGKPIEFWVYPREGHIKSGSRNRLEIYQRNVDWFNFWLRDIEDGDPAKTEQYERWRQLRKK